MIHEYTWPHGKKSAVARLARCSPQALSNILAGRYRPSHQLAARLAAVLGVDPREVRADYNPEYAAGRYVSAAPDVSVGTEDGQSCSSSAAAPVCGRSEHGEALS
jgi:transcriptional regulator with XRE-family HTH domain